MLISALITIRNALFLFIILSGTTLYFLCNQIISDRFQFDENVENKTVEEEMAVTFNLEHCDCKR